MEFNQSELLMGGERRYIVKNWEGRKMPYFQKKPVVIEAVQWTGENWDAVRLLGARGTRPFVLSGNKEISIATLEGEMLARVGDYIIKGVKGECYPCKPDIFHLTYEEFIG